MINESEDIQELADNLLRVNWKVFLNQSRINKERFRSIRFN